MNGINNNVSNSNYSSLGNNTSNSQKEEESIFDKALDYAKNFFSDEDGEDSSNSTSKSSTYATSGNNLDKAYLNSKFTVENTYTLTPVKREESLTEKWAKENESAELKQKDKEIAKLQQTIYSLKSKNKLLAKHNAQIIEQTQAAQTVQTQNGVQNTQQDQSSGIPASGSAEHMTAEAQNEAPQELPTHTSIPKKVLEQQQQEVEALAANSKVEAPAPQSNVEDTKPKKISDEAKA